MTVATDNQAASSGSEVRWFRDDGTQPRLDPDAAVRTVNVGVEFSEGRYVFQFVTLRRHDPFCVLDQLVIELARPR
jgi:hypothetical protein